MLWLVFPILGTIFYCIGGYIKNYLSDNALPRGKAGSYSVARIFGHILLITILLALFGRAVFMVPVYNAIGFMVAGAINVVALLFNCRALQRGDAADVSIFGQISPIISLGLGVLLLGESINANQGLGFVFIMGAVLFVIVGNTGKSKGPNLKVATDTVVSAFFSIFSDIIYAYFLFGTADYVHFAQAFFFFEFGCILTSILALIFFESWRNALKKAFFIKKGHHRNLAYALTENLVFITGDTAYKLGLMLAPVKSLVAAISKVVDLFTSLFITIVFGRVFPKFISGRRPSKKMLMRYAMASIFIIVGLIMIS